MSGPRTRVRIWDLPTRLFHWLLVLLIPFQWWTAEKEKLELHIAGGVSLLALLLFRLVWGLIGSSTARFTSFVRGPGAVISDLRGQLPHAVGHSPIGALSVVAMLALLSVQIGLGLFASDDDGLESGPLSYLVSEDLSEEIADLHEELFDVLLVLIGLHIAALLFYALFQRKNLVTAMITGSGDAPPGTRPIDEAPAWRFLVAGLLAAGAALWIGGYV